MGEIDNEIPHIKKSAFLMAYAQNGNITVAAQAAGIDRGSHYDWMRDPDYAAAFAAAKESAADLLVEAARRRAMDGVDEPVFYMGKEIKTVKKYSDVLLMFLLKGIRPDVYKDRFEHTGANNGPIMTKVGIDLTLLTDADIAKELQQLEELDTSTDGKEIIALEGTEDSPL